MSEEDKKNRKFQFELTKAQVDFEFWFGLTIILAIGILAIGYGLLSYYRENFLAIIVSNGLLLIAFSFVIRIYVLKEKRFKDIKKTYIES